MLRRLITPLLAFLLVITTAVAALAAPPPLPSSFYGTVTLNGATIPDGTRISAWIGGVKVAEASSRTVNGASSYTIDVPGVDASTEGATISFQVDGYAADGSATWHSGSVTLLNLSATPPPVAPVANNGSVTTAEDTPVAITLSAFDANNDPLTYTIVTAPAHGALSGAAPTLLYTPDLDYNGTDSFTFKVSDGSLESSVATVSITITPVADEPTAQNLGLTTDEDTGVVFTLQASDPNGDPLTFTVLTAPAHGALSGTPPGLIYDPAPNFNGADSFTFKVNDGRFDSNVATVNITVRSIPDAPQIAGVTDTSMDEGQILNITIPSVDPDGTTPTLTSANLPAFATFTANNGTATLRFAPDFTQAGTYPNITVTAADGALSASTAFTLTVNDVTPMPQANFSTSKDLNAAQWEDGASIAAVSSVFSTANSHRAENAIDNNAGTAWYTANGQPNNQWIKVALTGNTVHVIDRVVIRGSTSTASLKDFQIRVSTTGSADADFTTVFTGSVPLENNFFTYTFAPVQARYVQLFVVNNWGFGSYSLLLGFEARTRGRDGGIVSLIDGPRPTVESFTSQYDTGHRVEYALDDDPNSRWATGNGQRTNQSLVIKLAGGQRYAIDRVRVQPRFDCCFDQRVKDFEIWVSDDNVNFTQVLAATAADNGNLQEFVFPGGPVDARYVKYVALNNRGANCCISTATFQVITLDGHNVARLGGVGGAVISASSQWDAARFPARAIDFDTATDWLTGNGQVTNQSLKILLAPGLPHRIDRVRIRSHAGSTSLKDFQIRVSATGAADSDFVPVYSGTLPNDGAFHWYTFAPVDARYVQLVLVNNYGHGSYIGLYDFQVYSTQLGGERVPFDDFSTNPFGPIVAWDWDFGDGGVSSERHPAHTFAAPGTYNVTLTVTNGDGVTDTVTLPYTVLQRPTADFTWTPATPDEGQNVNLADASTDADGSVIGWLWKFHYTTSQPTTQNPTANFPDSGDHPVVLTVTDSQLLTTVVTRTIPVNNVTPTVDIGPATVIRRTGERLRIPGDETFRNWNDPSSVDRAAMQFLWDTGDGRTFTTQNVDYSYATPGTYTVRLTLTDPQGATATDTLQVTVYDDAVAPTTSVIITGSQNVALPETLNIPSLLSMGASIHSFSSQFNSQHSPVNLLDLNTGDYPWATQTGKVTNQWVIIRLVGDQPHIIDRIHIQPRANCCPEQRVKDFEVWVSATTADEISFTRVLSATAADNGNVQEFVLPDGPVAARFVKYVALNARSASACCISTSSFHVISTEPLGSGGVVAVSSQFSAANGPEMLLDDHRDSIWRTANGQNSGWVKILLAGGQPWPVHGVTLQTDATAEAVKDFEIWVSNTDADDASFTRIFTGTMSTTSAQQDFFFPEVNARYVKLIALNNRGSSCCVRVGTLQVRASVPTLPDGWFNTDVLVTVIAADNPGGSGVAKIETSTNGANWSVYTGPFLFDKAGSNPVWGRATDVARNLGAPDQRYAAIDKTPKLARFEAGQVGVDWLATAAINKSTNVLKCVACHVQGDSLHGLAVSTSTGYRVDTDADSDLVALVNFMTEPANQRPANGLWVHPPPNGNSYLTMNSSHSLFGLAMYDRLVSTAKTDSLILGVEGMLPRQQSNGRWQLDHNMAPTNQGDILPTAHMIFALQQAKTRVDASTAARYQTALDRAVTWLRTASLSIYTQDKTMKLLGLLEAGAPRTDADVVALRTQILADQLADGGWREDTNRTWSSVFATGQSLYALCRAGVSRFDPQVVKGIDWLIHTQTGHNSDTLVQRYLQDGPWLLQYTGAAAPFVSTMWAVIALGCFGELGLDFNITPDVQQIEPDVATTQTVTFTVSLANTGAEDDIYDLAISGGLPGWVAAVSVNPVSLAVGANTTVDLVITAPANQPQNLVTLYSVTATSRKNPTVTRAASVSISTSALPTGGRPTLTRIIAGNGVDSPVDYPIRLAAVVTDTVDNLSVTGPDSGVVNFLVAGIAVGSDADADGDGVYEILWTPGAAWTRLGSQDLRAIYSGVDRPDPQPDLQSSFASGSLTLSGAVRPVANDQSLTTDKNTPLPITLTATDPNGDALTFSVATTPTYGTLSGAAPDLTYTPDAGFVGDDSFTFTASDGSNVSLPATVSIRVISTNEPPILDDVDDVALDEGTTLTVAVTASDPDGDALTLTAGNLPTFASFVDNGDGTGNVVFMPDYEAAGIYASLAITVSDGELTDSDMFTITVNNVNRGPILDEVDNVTMDEGTTLTVTVTAGDADGDALTLTAGNLPTFASFTDNGDGTGRFVFAPGYEDAGLYASITITVSDGELTDSDSFTLTVNNVNRAPVAVDQTLVTDEDTPLPVTLTAADADGDPLTFSVVSTPTHGTLSGSAPDLTYTPAPNYHGEDSFTFTASDGSVDSTIATISITVNPINDAPALQTPRSALEVNEGETATMDGNFADVDGDIITLTASVGDVTGNPDGSWTWSFVTGDGPDESQPVTISAADGNGGSADVVFGLTVLNLDPVAVDDSAGTDENTAVSIPVLANDSDVPADTLTVTALGLPSHGAAAVSGPSSAVIYTPTLDFSGSDVFTYTVSDEDGGSATATVTVTVNSVNDAPVLENVDDAMMDEGATLTVTVTAGDPDGDALTLTAGNLPTFANFTDNGDGTGRFVFAPGYEDAGIYAGITVTVSDGELTATDTFTLTVNNVNRGPFADDDSATTDEDTPVTIDLLTNDSDPDGDALSLTVLGTPAHGAAAVGSLPSAVVYTPTLNFSGTDTFTYTVSDGSLSATATVTVTVNPINDAPSVDDVEDVMMDEGATLTATVTAGDADGDALALVAGDLPTFANFTDNGDGTGRFVFAPGYDDAGIYASITVTVSDGSLTDSDTFTLTVNNVNRVPIASDDSATTDEDTPVTIDLLANDSDPDGDALSLTVLGTPAHGAAVAGPLSAVVYTPTAGFSGTDTFTYTVSDGSLSATATVTITVNAPAPVACDLYPIALHVNSLNGAVPGGTVVDIFNGSGPGNFGWLSWTGNPNVPTLIASLTPPGDSYRYTNPNDASDHVVSAGDWVRGSPGVSNAKGVRDALDRLKTMDIMVPVWESAGGSGNNAQYRVISFATVRLLNYRLPGQNRISVRYLGSVNCGAAQNRSATEIAAWEASLPPLDESLLVEDGLIYLPLLTHQKQAAQGVSTDLNTLFLPVVATNE